MRRFTLNRDFACLKLASWSGLNENIIASSSSCHEHLDFQARVVRNNPVNLIREARPQPFEFGGIAIESLSNILADAIRPTNEV